MGKLRFKFTFKLVLLLLLVGLIPLLFSSLFSFFLAENYLEKLTFLNLERMNQLASLEIENFMAQGFNNIATLAYNPILNSPKTSVEEKSAELEKIRRYYKLFRDITILDKNGRVITSSAYRFYGRWELNSWFLEAKTKKEIVVSDIYAIFDPQEPVLAFFSPILDEDGQIIFFIVAQLDTEILWQIIDFKIGEKGYIFLINSRGDIISHPQRSLLFEKIAPSYPLEQNSLLKKGITKFNFQNENLVASFNVLENYQGFPGHNWHLILAQPEKEAFAFLTAIKSQIYIFLLFFLILVVWVSFFFSRYITEPLKNLIGAAREVSRGNLETQVGIKTRDEIGEMAVTFNEMVRGLKTSRAALEEEKNKTLAVITNLTDGLLVFDEEKKLSLINPQAEALLGVKSQNIQEKSILELKNIPVFESLITIFGEEMKKVSRQELSLGPNLILEVSTIPIIRGEEEIGTLVVLHDITREKAIERMKSEFVSLSAHQLRTPLSAIKWTLKMLLDGDFGRINQEQKGFIEEIYNSNEKMISLIAELLDVARMEEGRYVSKTALGDIEKVVLSVISLYKKEIKRKKLKFEFEKPEKKLSRIQMDEEKIKLAIDNLLDNAIRYTPPKGRVKIGLSYGIKGIECKIQDTGVGIPKNQQERVFSRFFRGSNITKMETEGTGLGLFITKNIIEAHGGKIWFESEENKGTTFYFTLPVAKSF